MASSKNHHAELAVLALGFLVLAAWVGLRIHSSRLAESAPAPSVSRSDTSAPLVTAPEALATLTWDGVEAAATSTNQDAILAATLTSTHPPAVYVRGLLLLARSNAPAALETFQAIGPSRVPASHLYAPYRLHGAIRPGTTNPFLPGLRAAMEQGNLDPLIAARVHAREGDFERALQSYLKTDPARWVRLDVALFRTLLNHEGVATETRVLIEAALRGDRVPPELRTDLRQLRPTIPAQDTNATAAMRGRLTEFFRQHPAELALAVTGVVKQITVRRQFLEKRYLELLENHRDARPIDLSDETVLLLVLSAAAETNKPALGAWSQELRRRFPDREVEQWLNSLRTAGP